MGEMAVQLYKKYNKYFYFWYILLMIFLYFYGLWLCDLEFTHLQCLAWGGNSMNPQKTYKYVLKFMQ